MSMAYLGQQQVITTQPGQQRPGQGMQWMQAPAAIPNCPPGLEYLTLVDQLLCHQVVELLEAFTGFDTNNKYAIKNSMGQQVYYAFEDTDFCMRLCCGAQRGFTIKIVDNFQREVMRVTRPFVCLGGCCWCASCCGFSVDVEAPPGQLVGRVVQATSACSFDFFIENAAGERQLFIKGPCCTCRCCADVNFPVLALNQTDKVGLIAKQWSGFVKEAFTNADNFGIQFPMDLDVRTKATLIGATFLIDFMAFEDKNKNNNNSWN